MWPLSDVRPVQSFVSQFAALPVLASNKGHDMYAYCSILGHCLLASQPAVQLQNMLLMVSQSAVCPIGFESVCSY